MTDEVIQNATPAEQVSAEQVQSDASNSAESSTEQTQEQQTEQQKEEGQKREPWFQKRIGELTREKYEAKRAAEQAQQEAAQYREYLARMQQGEQPQRQPSQPANVQELARQEASKMLADQRFIESTDKVWNTGVKEYQDFDRTVSNLQMLGMDRQFVELAVESDAGHKVLHYLGQEANLDEAARILRLHPVQQARELTRLEYKLNQPQAKPVSKAPAPIKPIGTGGATDSGLSDDLPIEEWMRRHSKKR